MKKISYYTFILLLILLINCTSKGLRINFQFYSEKDLWVIYQLYEGNIKNASKEKVLNSYKKKIQKTKKWLIEQEVTYYLAIQHGLLQDGNYYDFYLQAEEVFRAKLANLYWSKKIANENISFDVIKRYYNYQLDYKKTFKELKAYNGITIGEYDNKALKLSDIISLFQIKKEQVETFQKKNFEYFQRTFVKFEEFFFHKLALEFILKENFLTKTTYLHFNNFSIATDFVKAKYLYFKKGFYPVDAIPIELKQNEIYNYLAKKNNQIAVKSIKSNWIVLKKNKELGWSLYNLLKEKKETINTLIKKYKDDIFLKKLDALTKPLDILNIEEGFHKEEEHGGHSHDQEILLSYDTIEEELEAQIHLSILSKAKGLINNIYYENYLDDEYIFIIQILDIAYNEVDIEKKLKEPIELTRVKYKLISQLLREQYIIDRFDVKHHLFIKDTL